MKKISKEFAVELVAYRFGGPLFDVSVVDISLYYKGKFGPDVDQVVFQKDGKLWAFYVERDSWHYRWDNFDGKVYPVKAITTVKYEAIR